MNRSATHRFPTAVTALALGLAASLVTLSAQAAAPAPRHDSIVVRYDDLNLASSAGARVLYARIASAADRACGGAPQIRELRQQQSFRSCVNSTVEEAMKSIDDERLQALHTARAAVPSVG